MEDKMEHVNTSMNESANKLRKLEAQYRELRSKGHLAGSFDGIVETFIDDENLIDVDYRDEGIGSYEYWGFSGNDVDYKLVFEYDGLFEFEFFSDDPCDGEIFMEGEDSIDRVFATEKEDYPYTICLRLESLNVKRVEVELKDGKVSLWKHNVAVEFDCYSSEG